jgi:putative effector of murein hydrolase
MYIDPEEVEKYTIPHELWSATVQGMVGIVFALAIVAVLAEILGITDSAIESVAEKIYGKGM